MSRKGIAIAAAALLVALALATGRRAAIGAPADIEAIVWGEEGSLFDPRLSGLSFHR